MLLIVHGEVQRVSQEKSDEYLKRLNVYNEIMTLQRRIDEEKYNITELKPLKINDSLICQYELQKFINVAVKYAHLRFQVKRTN